jgi:PAS domain S-box-containing protein
MIRILYVDDSSFDRALVRDALEREAEGFSLTEAATREELEGVLATDGPFDLVLSDFNILGMTGLEVIRRVKDAFPTVPVILVTGTGSEEVAVKALKAGASDYVIKQPNHIRRLPQTILTTLSTHAALLERDEARRALEASETRYRLLAEGSADLLLRISGEGRILHATPAALAILGVEGSALEGRAFLELVTPEDREVAEAFVEGILARAGAETNRPGTGARARFRMTGGGTEAAEGGNPALEGSGHEEAVAWVEASGRGVPPRATPSGETELLLSLRDIRDRVRMEAALARSRERLQEVQRLEAVGRLAGGVAHDFNNLLTVIQSNAELMLEELEAEHPVRQDAEEIATAARRAGELTRHLLHFSSGDLAPHEILEPGPLVRESATLLTRGLPERIRLLLEVADELPLIRSSAARFQQVLLNLGLNARDALGGAGTIRIQADHCSAEPYLPFWPGAQLPAPEARLLRIQVRDNGCGMPPEVRRRLFEPFFTTKPMGHGTGLGLANAFGTIRHAGGTILVDSAPGEGSLFTVLIPEASSVGGEREP